ncbi:MAG TPA: hypothetical protein VK920_05570 [Solirubrobacterales bacterium]|nr:hypothetical protein [Solirubrobacterales bacterium]
MPAGKPPQAICSRTGLTVPECSCGVCLEQQIRRFMPRLLERDGGDATPPANGAAGRRRWRSAA